MNVILKGLKEIRVEIRANKVCGDPDKSAMDMGLYLLVAGCVSIIFIIVIPLWMPIYLLGKLGQKLNRG